MRVFFRNRWEDFFIDEDDGVFWIRHHPVFEGNDAIPFELVVSSGHDTLEEAEQRLQEIKETIENLEEYNAN